MGGFSLSISVKFTVMSAACAFVSLGQTLCIRLMHKGNTLSYMVEPV